MVYTELRQFIYNLVGFNRVSGAGIDDSQLLVFLSMAAVSNKLGSPDFPTFSFNYTTSGISPEPAAMEGMLLALRAALDIELQFASEAVGDAIAIKVGPVSLNTGSNLGAGNQLLNKMSSLWKDGMDSYKMHNLVSGIAGNLGRRIEVFAATRNDISDPDRLN